MEVDQAMFLAAMPCNPRPFINGLKEMVDRDGPDVVKTDKFKRVLWVLLSQAYGQCATISLTDEFFRLSECQKNQLNQLVAQ